MARVNKVNSYLIERFAFNVWWNVAQCANPGDAHLVAKALRDATNKSHRVMKNDGTTLLPLGEYQAVEQSTTHKKLRAVDCNIH